MNQPMDPLRRNLLASFPAFLLAPAALAQQGLVNPQKNPKVASTAQRDVPILPFALAGGLHDDATVWPWTAGLLCQAGFVYGYIGYRRRWWC